MVSPHGAGQAYTFSISRQSDEASIRQLHPGESIRAGVGVVHAFVLDPGSILACVSSAAFDLGDMPKVELVELAGDGTVGCLVFLAEDSQAALDALNARIRAAAGSS